MARSCGLEWADCDYMDDYNPDGTENWVGCEWIEWETGVVTTVCDDSCYYEIEVCDSTGCWVRVDYAGPAPVPVFVESEPEPDDDCGFAGFGCFLDDYGSDLVQIATDIVVIAAVDAAAGPIVLAGLASCAPTALTGCLVAGVTTYVAGEITYDYGQDFICHVNHLLWNDPECH